MIRTSLEHFQRLPCMSKACDEWEEFEQEQEKDDITSTTWKEFKTLLNRKFLAYDNQQEILQEAGIANSAIEKEEIQDLFDQRDSVVAALLDFVLTLLSAPSRNKNGRENPFIQIKIKTY